MGSSTEDSRTCRSSMCPRRRWQRSIDDWALTRHCHCCRRISWRGVPRRYDLWHDRAVFHFLVDPIDRGTYLRALHSAIRPGGSVIMATFASDGPEYCSGLPVARYSSAALVRTLGPDFRVIEDLRDRHVTPAGVEQPFTWVVARHTGPDRVGENDTARGVNTTRPPANRGPLL